MSYYNVFVRDMNIWELGQVLAIAAIVLYIFAGEIRRWIHSRRERRMRLTDENMRKFLYSAIGADRGLREKSDRV